MDFGAGGIDVATADGVITLTSVVDDESKPITLMDLVSSYGLEVSEKLC